MASLWCLNGRCSSETFQKLFVDLRVICAVMCVWLLIVVSVFVDLEELSKTESDFFHFGPRPSLVFFHTPIDTHAKYNGLVCLIVAHTAISDCLSDSLNPHVLNIVQNRANRYMPHSKTAYYLITSIWSVYCAVSSLFTIYLALGQIDLLLVRLLSDVVANLFTMTMYMKGKVHDPRMYNETVSRENMHDTQYASSDVSTSSNNRLISERLGVTYSVDCSDDENAPPTPGKRRPVEMRTIVSPAHASESYYSVQDIRPQSQTCATPNMRDS